MIFFFNNYYIEHIKCNIYYLSTFFNSSIYYLFIEKERLTKFHFYHNKYNKLVSVFKIKILMKNKSAIIFIP